MAQNVILLHLVSFFRNVTDYFPSYKALEKVTFVITFQKLFLQDFFHNFQDILIN